MATTAQPPPPTRDGRARTAGIPADWARRPGWVLLPLRAFLGLTFAYAGLSKIAEPAFLDDAAPTSLHSTVAAVRDASPIGFLLGPIESHSAVFGAAIAIAETAIGLGLLSGLMTRLAALGGIALSLGLFLTVSWNADPWYTGADLPFAFALTPLALAGAGGVLSLDGWLAAVAARHAGQAGGSPGADRMRRGLLATGLGVLGLLAIGGAALSRAGRSPASSGEPAGSDGTPSAGPTSDGPTSDGPTSDGPTSDGTAPDGTAQPTPAQPTTAPSPSATGAVLVAASAVGVGQAKLVRDPRTGHDDLWVMQLESGEFTAVNGVCPHQGCVVEFRNASAGFVCPCHNSRFSSSGQRLSGPAIRGLTNVPVVLSGDSVRLD